MSNLPPVEPPDLHNRRQRGQQNYQSSENYPPPNPPRPPAPQPQQPPPPQQPSYPPPGQGNYPPPGQQPYNPPPPQQPRQPNYQPPTQQPPPPAYPPQNPGWEDPVVPARRGAPRGTGPLQQPPSGLEDVGAPDLRRPRNYATNDQPRGGGGGGGATLDLNNIFSEGQFEALIWGIVVIMLGFAVILALTSNSDWLTSYWPLMSGILLFGSIIFQKVIMRWRVSMPTQLLATLLIAYSITQLIAGEADNFLTLAAYYLGTLIITAGIIILSGIFRRPNAR